MLLQQDPIIYQRPDAETTVATRMGVWFDSRARPRCIPSQGAKRKVHRANPDENILMSTWVKALEKYISTKGEEVIPPGWQTRNEIAKLFGRTPSTTSRIIAEMMKEGKAETRKFKGAVYAGEKNQKKLMKGGPRQKYLRLTPYFRLISTPIKPPASKSYKQSSK